ncbi:alpha/beta hydrolase [Rhodococcus sp. NPDC049939]|uniref:alpha/beta hydrolase n=1 Tax=Rhodococcus sp. NPDC049939 TaxID=3155511 RepID=UPI0033DED5E1
MSLQFDPQVLQELAPQLAATADLEPPAVGDVATRRLDTRRVLDQLLALRGSSVEYDDGIDIERYSLTTDDGAELGLSWYHRVGSAASGSAALYIHGGGMILGLDEVGKLYDLAVRGYVEASGVPMLVVDYRIAPEYPHPVPVEDCYAALEWLASRAGELGADPGRLAVMGDSAGGGLAAGVCLLARDRNGPAIAQQLLIYPMLDDRTSEPDPQLLPFLKWPLTWTYDDNVTGWSALLGDGDGRREISQYAAPSRAVDLSGLPPTYIEVGELDIFRGEDITYGRRLADAGIPTELHLHPGCPHAFEGLAPDADVSRRAIADRVRRLRSL